MKIRAIYDCHAFSTESVATWNQISDAILTCPDDRMLVYGGDNLDFKNSWEKDLEFLRTLQKSFREAVKKRGGVYIGGNHDPDGIFLNEQREGYYFCHGDIEFWGLDKAFKFRNKNDGAGWFKRNIFIHLLDDLRCLIDPGPNKRFREFMNVVSAHTVICGHRHPKQNLVGEIDGKTYMILKRGIQDLDL